jgi:hypothetical protein
METPQGMLALMNLKALDASRRLHGDAISRRVKQISPDLLTVNLDARGESKRKRSSAGSPN